MISNSAPRAGRTRRAFLLAGSAALAAPALGQGTAAVSFGTNWLAQAEHGGFYQALADGTYRRLGLDVRLVPGGPNVNSRALLAAGRLDFYMGGSLLQPFAAVAEGVPTVVVAAMFQKEPQALLAHPSVTSWDELKRIPLLISRLGEATFYRWLVAEHGFRPEQLRPYNFNPAPFCADARLGQQGYVTAEPFAILRACGIVPSVFLLADHGYDTYSTLIETRRATLDTRSDVVRRFVEGSILGWANYLHGDSGPAEALIRRDNAEMSEAQLAFSKEKMKAYGIVDSGDSLQLGLGAMTEARIGSFHERMTRAGIVPAGIDWRRCFDARFVNKGLGNDLRRP